MEIFLLVITKPLPWYIAGVAIGLVILLLQWLDNKPLAASSSYRHLCAASFPGSIKFLNYHWKAELWNLYFVIGIFMGGIIAQILKPYNYNVDISPETKIQLHNIGISDTSGFNPDQLFSFHAIFTIPGFVVIILGGFLIGFGSRYAGGCVSGHSLTGISDIQWTSVLATCCIFAGGIFTAFILLPFLLKLGL